MKVSTFSDFVKQEDPVTPSLPLLHTCEGYDFRSILSEQKLKTFPCKDFEDEPLLFFFYGKPSFRTSKGETSTSNLAFMPVALAVQPGSLTSIKRIAPFDTGAFFRNLFSSHMHPRMQCTDFLLNPSLDMPGRLVARFFGSNENYYFGRPRHLLIPPLAFEVQAYYDLIRGSGQTPYDDRRSAVELQSSESLILDQSSVMLVILPGEFLDDQEIRDIIVMEWAAEVKTYSVHHSSPREYMSQLYREVEEFLREHNYL